MAGSDRVFYFKAYDENQANEWVFAIKVLLESVRGKHKRQSVMGTTAFWRVRI